MGKPTGFMDYKRELPLAEAPADIQQKLRAEAGQ